MVNRGRWCETFNNFDQQDAHEAFTYLIDKCNDVDVLAIRFHASCAVMSDDEFRLSSSRYSTPCDKLFAQVQVKRVRCGACNVTTQQYESFYAHALSLAPGLVTLDALFKHHLADEAVDGAWRCDEWSHYGNGTIMKDVVHWPQVLVVSIKRFSYARGRLRKLTQHVQFNERWEMQPGIGYQLAGVIEHQGHAGLAGHYVAYVRAADGMWYLCNDTRAPCVVPVAHVLRQEAYMLMYTRQP